MATDGDYGWDQFAAEDFDMGSQTDVGLLEANDYNMDPSGYAGSASNAYTGGGDWGNYLNTARQGYQAYQGTQQGRNTGIPQQQGQYQMNIPGLLAGLYGVYGARQNQQQNQQLMNQIGQGGDPFGPQRGFYQDQLRQSYQDPQQMWNSPQWQALRSQMLEESTARDAAGGRLSDFGNRDRLVAREFMGNYLPRIQQNLQGPAGAGANPGAGAALQAGMAGQMNQANRGQSASIGVLLDELFGGQQPGTVNRVQNGGPAQNNDLFQQLMQWYQNMSNGGNTYTDVQ